MQRWTIHLEGGPRRVNHAAVDIDNRIFSFGGYCTGEDYETTRPMDVHVLDTVTYRWSLLRTPDQEEPSYRDVPYQRYGHTAVAWGDCAYIWGGRNDKDGACNILFCFDTTNCKWCRPQMFGEIPGARDGHSACVINGKMYIFGGYEERVDKFSNEVHALDFETMMWTMLKTHSKPARWRDFHSATGIGHNMYIFGGRSDRGGPYHTNHEIYCNQIQVYNTLTNTWHEPAASGEKPAGRRSHSAFVHKGGLYIFGGYNGLHDIHFRDLYKYDPEKAEWSLVKVNGDPERSPCARRRQCCCVINDRVFLFGGTSPCSEPMEGTEFDLIDQSDLHVLDFSPSLRTLCMLTVIKTSGLDTNCLPSVIRMELTLMTTDNKISRPLNMSG